VKNANKLWAGVLSIAILSVAAFMLVTRDRGLTAEAVTGRVFEVRNPYASRAAWILEPLPDAEVLVVWRAEVDLFVDSQFMCVRAGHTKSNADGTFSLPAAKVQSKSKSALAASYAYKEGYVDVSVTSSAEEFGSTVDHVRILRKVSDPGKTPSREDQLKAAQGCPAVYLY
jgi:hypothetical protein